MVNTARNPKQTYKLQEKFGNAVIHKKFFSQFQRIYFNGHIQLFRILKMKDLSSLMST